MSNIIKQKERGSLVVISGPSGCGKDSVVAKYLEKKKNAWLSISCTSRAMRPGDEEGKTYFFLSKEEFEKKIKEDEFLEYAIYNDNYYGTPKAEVKDLLETGKDIILVIDVKGAEQIKKLFPSVILIFVMAPSMSEVKRRIISRGKESADQIIKRFQTAYNEINEYHKYNYVVVNDILDDAVNKIEAILLASKCRVDRIEEVSVENQEEIIHEFLIGNKFDNKPFNLDNTKTE